MKKQTYMALACLAGMSVMPPAIAASSAAQTTAGDDTSALHALWAGYEHAVASKDAAALLTMYVDADVPVVGAIAPRSYAVISAANKQAVPRTMRMTAKDDVTGEVKLPPDQIENLSIHTDGEVGTVSFDYKAKIGHGRIIWSTVHTNDGWKIAAVVYSINVPAADKPHT
ncbi:hypothetical protein [Dyella acidiphila]|uniref:DUF4440 domain-containing protein n=1 Tax=Dyella acidiphila TaxID=2775866 RepID=A0ABR9G747_9GAMM|nr:hypothetical protein [Dyella acidiphila]MBE1159874.1 hypothetical protein [Dyella acidiphila]